MVRSNYPVDGITDVSEPPTPAPSKPGKKTTSRLNGNGVHKSVSSESDTYAIKDGLLAREIAPQSDFRGHRTLYRKIRSQLIHEYQPDTFTDKAIVDSVALDYVRWVRANQLLELLETAQNITSEDHEKWREIATSTSDMKLIRAFIRHKGSPTPTVVTAKEAKRIAKHVVQMVTNVQIDLDDIERDAELDPTQFSIPDPPPFVSEYADEARKSGGNADDMPNFGPPTKDDTEFEEAEEREFDELVKLIGSASERLRDAKYVEGVLRGKRKPRAGDWRRLRGLLERIVEWWEKKDKDPRKVIRRMKNAYLVHQVALVDRHS